MLSSDEEEGADPDLHPLFGVADADALEQSFLDAVAKSPDVFNDLDMQVSATHMERSQRAVLVIVTRWHQSSGLPHPPPGGFVSSVTQV